SRRPRSRRRAVRDGRTLSCAQAERSVLEPEATPRAPRTGDQPRLVPADTRSMLDQPLSRRLRAIREADEADLIPAVEPEPEPQSLAAPRRGPLGRLLVENGALSESDLEEALERQRTDARPLGQILMDMGAVTAQELARALTGQHGLDSSHT